MSDLRVLVMGDSHVATLQLGLRKLRKAGTAGGTGVDFDFLPFGGAGNLLEPFFSVHGGYVELDHSDLRGHGERIPPPEPYDRYVLSAALNTWGVVRNRATWKHFRAPGVAPARTGQTGRTGRLRRAAKAAKVAKVAKAAKAATGAGPAAVAAPGRPRRAPLSEAVLEQMFADRQRHIRAFVTALHDLDLPLLIVEPPAPFRETKGVQGVGERQAREVNRLMRASALRFLEELDIPVVRVPEACLDEDGFTKERFAHPRWPHHGNADFGEVMLNEIVRAVR